MTMKKPSSGSRSKANNAQNALPPEKRAAPDSDALLPAAPLLSPPSPAMATRMLAEAEAAEAAARAEKVAARRAALGKRVRELVAERVSAVEAKATTTTTAAARALQQGPTKALKLEPIPEGRGVVSEPLAAEERRRLAREARRALEQMRAAREMAENKAERRGAAGCQWAKEQGGRRTPEERARDEAEAGALHERLRRETPSAPHCERTVKSTHRGTARRMTGGCPGCRRSTRGRRTRGGRLDDGRPLGLLVDADEHGPPTPRHGSFKGIGGRAIGRRLTGPPFARRLGAGPVFRETERSRAARAALYGVDGLRRAALRDACGPPGWLALSRNWAASSLRVAARPGPAGAAP
jgi:hypothetical protein